MEMGIFPHVDPSMCSKFKTYLPMCKMCHPFRVNSIFNRPKNVSKAKYKIRKCVFQFNTIQLQSRGALLFLCVDAIESGLILESI